MKPKDIALVVFVSIASIGIAYFATNAILGDPGESKKVFTRVSPISGSFEEPDDEVFNATRSINPTKDIYIGNKCDELAGEVWNEVVRACVKQPTDSEE